MLNIREGIEESCDPNDTIIEKFEVTTSGLNSGTKTTEDLVNYDNYNF